MWVKLESLSEYITNTEGQNVNKIDSYLFCDRFDWRNKNSEFGTRERWRSNLARWHHLHRYPEFKKEFVNFEKVVSLSEDWVGLDGGRVSLYLFIEPYRFFLSFVLLNAVWTSNNKWLLIVDGEFLLLSSQPPGNFFPTDYPERLKKFWIDWVIPCLWIFQT